MGEVNHTAWARSMIGFIRERGLEREFQDWCGGWPCRVATAAERPNPDWPTATAALVALAEHGIAPDIGELLTQGNPSRGIAPGAIFKVIAAINLAQSTEAT